MHFDPARFTLAWLGSLLVGLASGCSTPHPPTAVKAMVEGATEAAEVHLEAGNPVEASELTRAVLRVDPDFAPALGIQNELPPDLDAIYRNRSLGSNLARRVDVDRSTAAKVLLYPVDRFLDLCDIVSIDLHVGGGAFLNYHFTRAVQIGAGLRAVTGIGWHERRSLGSKSQAESGIVFLPFGAEVTAVTLAGTSGVYSAADSITGLHRASSPVYQEYRDYWAVGVGVTIAFLGYDIDFHPVQMADFLAGWTTFDFLNDDFARTRGLNLSRTERRWMSDLYKLEREPHVLEEYERLRETEAEEARLAAEAEREEAERAAAEAAAAAAQAEQDSLANRLRELQEAHEQGLITDEEYESGKRELMDDL